MQPSSALPWRHYRDPMIVLEEKQEAEAAAEKHKRGDRRTRAATARQRAEALFTKHSD